MNLTLSRARPAHLEALLTTVIWASSFIFVKLGLEYIGPFTLSGIRYILAFLILLPLLREDTSWRRMGRREWAYLTAIGLTAFTVGNGMLYWGLKYLPATTSAFLSAFTPLPVLVAGIIWLRERPTLIQVVGVLLSIWGAWLYFSRSVEVTSLLGVVLTLISLLGFTLFSILGRAMARTREVSTLVLTTIPLGIGGLPMLVIGPFIEGMPRFTPASVGIILWLALINSALAYLIYNHALQSLTALEMNVMFNLITPITAVLAFFLLGERLTWLQGVGLIVTTVGVGLVQVHSSGDTL